MHFFRRQFKGQYLRIWILLLLLPARVALCQVVHQGQLSDLDYSIELQEKPGSKQQTWLFRIQSSKNLEPQVFSLTNPGRIIVDIPGRNIQKDLVIPVEHPDSPISQIRFGVHAQKIRIVLDSEQEKAPRYAASDRPGELRIQLQGKKIVEPEIPTPQIEQPAGADSIPAISSTRKTESSKEDTAEPAQTAEPSEIEDEEQEEIQNTEAQEEEADSEQSEQKVAAGLPEQLRFTVDRVHVQFDPGQRPIRNLIIRSKEKKSLFVTTKAFLVRNPGTEAQELVPTKELLVSPRRLELKPGKERTLRLVLNRSAEQKELVYRVQLIPQDDNFDSASLNFEYEGHEANLKLRYGLAVLVTAPPRMPDAQLRWKRDEEFVIFSNPGNSSLLLEEGQVCRESDNLCEALPVKRIYPGGEWRIQVEDAARFDFLKRIGEDDVELLRVPAL